ncbi:MAG: MFS transporter [Tissierellaceae bacterium]|nr:MFS transporter [Tissierellaceae bacterium]
MTLLKNIKDEKSKKRIILYSMLISMVLSYLPWYNFSAVSSYISSDLGFTVNQTSIILSAFQVGYVIVVLFTGWLADKIGAKKVVAWATLFTAIFSTMFVWLAKDFRSVLILRLLTGLSAGAIYVPGMSLLSKWFGPNERGKVLGAYTGAMTLAYAGGYFVAAPIAAATHWRYGILWTSLPAFIAAFIVFFVIEGSPDSYNSVTTLEANPTVTANTKTKKLGPALIIIGYMGHMWELYAFWGWIGPFMVACSIAVGYPQSEAVELGGRLAAFIILLGVPSSWIAGAIADKWGRVKTILLCSIFSLIVQFFLGDLYGKSLNIVMLVGLWIGFWVVADSAIYKAELTAMVPDSIRATVLGIQSALGYTVTIFSTYIFGRILESVNLGIVDTSLATNWNPPFIILGLGALIAPISSLILLITEKKEKKIQSHS